MACTQKCPLSYRQFSQSMLHQTHLRHLTMIENHVASGSCCRCSQLPLKDFVFREGTIRGISGTTPLIIVCRNGKLHLVKHLIEIWRVNVNATAKYSAPKTQKSNCKMEISASPLYVAAVNGHNHIVRYLLDKGADVSVKTSVEKGHRIFEDEEDEWTPLHGAVSRFYFDPRRPLADQHREQSAVVLSLLEYGADPIADSSRLNSCNGPMWLAPMCGVGAITALINHGLDLKRRTPNGETIMDHFLVPFQSTEEDSLTIVKLLIEKGADLLARDIKGFTPLQRVAYHTLDNGRLNFTALNYLLERDEYSRMEKIEAMELAGAAILSEPRNAQYVPKAFDFWNRALHLRHQLETAEEPGHSMKILDRKIGSHVEWTTQSELDQLEQHPENYRIQALLVQCRILSSFDGYDCHHRLSAYIFYHRDFYTKYYNDYHTNLTLYTDFYNAFNSLEDDEKFTQILDIVWWRFDLMIRRLDPPPTDSTFWHLVNEDVVELISTLSTLEDYHPNLLSFKKLKTSLDLLLLATNQAGIDINRFIFNLLVMIFRFPGIPDEHDTTSLTESLRLLGPCRLGKFLIWSTCYDQTSKYHLALIRVLLEAGADPNVVEDDLFGNGSLHFVAEMNDRILGDAAGLLLVEYGATLDQVNEAGKTALDIWIERNETGDNWNEEVGGWSARPEWCCPLPTLLRLAARVIRVKKIPYDDGATPANLHPFIELR